MTQPSSETTIQHDHLDPEELRFKLPDGLLLAGKGWGDESATVNVIAIHGYLDNAASFDRLAPLLVKESHGNIRIVAIDLSGHGKSAHRVDHTNYFTNWVTEVVTVADAMGWNQFSIIAHSMGTGVAVVLAGAIPERITHLVLLDAIGPNGLNPEQVPIRYGKALQERLQLIARQPRTYQSMNELVERMLQSDAQLTKDSAKLMVDRSAERTATGLRFSHDPKLRGTPAAIYLTEPEILEFMKRISSDTLIIWATHRWYPLDQNRIQIRQSCFKRLTVQHVEGNHHVHLEHADRTVKFIHEHLTKKPSSKL